MKYFFLLFFCVSCVSLNVELPKDQKAKGVRFVPPRAPYQEIQKEGMDKAYQHPQNLNTIAFFSNCSAATKFSNLKEFKKELLDGLKGYRLVTLKETEKQGQKALRLFLKQAQGGSLNKRAFYSVHLFLFQKDLCFYALSLVDFALDGDLAQTDVFEQFIREFKAP